MCAADNVSCHPAHLNRSLCILGRRKKYKEKRRLQNMLMLLRLLMCKQAPKYAFLSPLLVSTVKSSVIFLTWQVTTWLPWLFSLNVLHLQSSEGLSAVEHVMCVNDGGAECVWFAERWVCVLPQTLSVSQVFKQSSRTNRSVTNYFYSLWNKSIRCVDPVFRWNEDTNSPTQTFVGVSGLFSLFSASVYKMASLNVNGGETNTR